MNINVLLYILYVHVAVFGHLEGSKVYHTIHMRNITPAFTVIVILNVELICVNHNSKCRFKLITHQDIYLCWAVVSICLAGEQFKTCLRSPIPIIWRQCTALVGNLQLSIFFMCDWRAGGGPLKLNMDLELTLQPIGLFPAWYQIHVLCPNIRIWLWPPMDFVFVCNESLSGDLGEGFLSSGVKGRLRLLVQAVLRKGCGLQECGCWTQFLQIYWKDLQSDITAVADYGGSKVYMVNKSSWQRGAIVSTHL